MERTQDVDDLKECIAQALERARSLYERSLAIMDRATSQIHQSTLRVQRERALLQLSPQSTPSPRSSSPPDRS